MKLARKVVRKVIRKGKNGKNKITLIVLTGGPCAGKTTAVTYLIEELTNKGVHVLVMPEAATLCIMGGIHPGSRHVGIRTAQRAIMKTCSSLQSIWLEAAEALETDQPIVVILDRGLADCKAYAPEAMYHELLAEIGTSHPEVLAMADCVIHMVTAADGAPHAYTLENNAARYETARQAIATDRKIQRAWLGTRHLEVIRNTDTFEDKLRETLCVVLHAVGLPIPLEKELKFIVEPKGRIRIPSVDLLIQQFYGPSPGEREIRFRRILVEGSKRFGVAPFEYFIQTQKEPYPDGEGRFERNTPITADTWTVALQTMRDPRYRIITKRRKTFLYDGMYHELDKFIGMQLPCHHARRRRLLELEYTRKKPRISSNSMYEIIEEVTDNPAFSNKNMAFIG